MKVALVVLVAITLATLGYALVIRTDRSPAPSSLVVPPDEGAVAAQGEAVPSAAELAELRGRVAALRVEMAQLRGQVATKPVAPPPHEPATPEPSRPPPATQAASRDPAAMLEQEEARHAAMEELESAFQRQSADPRWADGATAGIRKALAADAVLRSVGGKVECRARTCRLEMLEDQPGKVSDRLRPLLSGLGETLPRSSVDYVHEGPGRTRIVVYLDKDEDPPAPGGR
jgi:hypothetical protein